MAEAWLAEAADSATREAAVWDELKDLAVERAAALADVEAMAQVQATPSEEPSAEERRVVLLDVARAEAERSDERRHAHEAAVAIVASVTEELAEAKEAERLATVAFEEADAAVSSAVDQEQAVLMELDRIEHDLGIAVAAEAAASEQLGASSDPEGDLTPGELAEAVTRAEAASAADQQAVARAAEAVAALDEERRQGLEVVAGLQDTGPDGVESASLAEEIEWYLLARLAAQRSVSLGGSVPLLLDDALTGLDEDEVSHVLGRLERMAEAVQVIVLSDDPLASSWALLAGDERAALVRPVAY